MSWRANSWERAAERFENHAATQIPGERVSRQMFTPAEEHNGRDAPGWCLKIARKMMKRANDTRKNFDSKQRERAKRRHADEPIS